MAKRSKKRPGGRANFSDEFSGACRKFCGRFCKQGKSESKFFETFGFVGPIIGSLFGLLMLIVGIFVLNFLNSILGSMFVSSVSDSIYSNLDWFFIFLVFFGYTDYLSKRYREKFWIVSPITSAIGVAIGVWVLVWALDLVNTVPGSALLSSMANFLYSNTWNIFLLVLVVGYIIALVKRMAKAASCKW
jgi:hypothetical protein